ncbi:MAG: ABC transporter permease [Sphingomonadales bacterium]|nr:ABC transporter permease [Sphingomonadales bacterium]
MNSIPGSLHTLFTLIRLELRSEWRQQNVLGGILLYAATAVFVAYMTFRIFPGPSWVAVYWLIMLFSSTHALGRSFGPSNGARLLFEQSLASPGLYLASKVIYNIFLLGLIHLLTTLCMLVWGGNPFQDLLRFSWVAVVGHIGLSGALTLIAAISRKASGQTTLMVVLSFPVVLPLMLLLIRLSMHALDGLNPVAGQTYLAQLIALDTLILSTAFLLFPYIWRD